MSGKVYEMLWDCPFCGTKKLLGKTHRHCPGCGAPQDPSYRYFPSDTEKVAVQDHVFQGADRLCPNCQTPNAAAATNCTYCGAPLDGAKGVALRADQVDATGGGFAGETETDARRELKARAQGIQAMPDLDALAPAAAAAGAAATGAGVAAMPGMPASGAYVSAGGAAAYAGSPPKKKSKTPILLGCGGLGCGGMLVVLVLILVFAFWTEPTKTKATAHSWTRVVEIEKFKSVDDSSWCDSMPSGAHGVTRKSEVRSHDKIPDGEDCRTVRHDNGDGTFSESESCTTKYREEPVYADKCYYEIDRWAHERDVTSSGQGLDPEPYWPDTGITQTDQTLGAEREGKRSETYSVTFAYGQGETTDCEMDLARWLQLPEGVELDAETRVIGGDLSCPTVKLPGE